MGIAGAAVAAGAIGAVGSAVSSSNAAGAARSAANTQSQSAAAASAQQAAQFQQTQNNLAPYNFNGQLADNLLGQNLGDYANPNQNLISDANVNQNRQQSYVDQAQRQFDAASRIGQGPGGQAALEATPGYQFELAQGLQATQNSAAARGLGVSGAAMKGAADYATGLASKNYQQQFQDAMAGGQATQSTANQFGNLSNANLSTNAAYQGNLTNSYNKLLGTANLGENAAANTGALGQRASDNQSALITGAGNAQAAGAVGEAKAANAGISGITGGIGNSLLAYAYMNQNGRNSGSSYGGEY